MSSIPKNSQIPLKRTPGRRTTRRRSTASFSSRGTSHARACGAKARSGKGGSTRSSSRVSDKLEALKNLIPAQNGEVVKPEQLFQETADYIVLLRTQVFVLQRLIEFYGSSSNERDNTNVVQ